MADDPLPPTAKSDLPRVAQPETCDYVDTAQSDPSKSPGYIPDSVKFIPGFEPLGELGRGGYGVVYKARQTKLNRIVALKLLLVDAPPGSKHLIRFLAEAESVAAIHHPHVVQVHEYGEHGGQPYMALEFCGGGTLAGRLHDEARKPIRLPAAEAAALLAKVAAGVAAAHDLGIIHRDLKPANIFLDDHGEPKVADFGIAKRNIGEHLTQTRELMGTPFYMAPEQAGSANHFVGPPADVWSLGVVLYEMLTGAKPFSGDTTDAILFKVMVEEPKAPRAIVPGLPRDLETICRKCLEKNPAGRYSTAKELATDLERLVKGEPIAARPAGMLERTYKWVRRKPAVAGLYGTTLFGAMLFAITLGFAWLWRDASEARDGEKEQRTATESAKREAEAARDGEKKAKAEVAFLNYSHAVDLAFREYKTNNLDRARALLDSCPLDLQSWEWRYVHRLCNPDLDLLKGHSQGVSSVSVSPDGNYIGSVDWGGSSIVWNTVSGAELARQSIQKDRFDRFDSVSFSPDSRHIAITTEKKGVVSAWSHKEGKEFQLLNGHSNSSFKYVCMSPDWSRLFVITPGNSGQIWDRSTGMKIATILYATTNVLAASFSPNSLCFAALLNNNTIGLWDCRDGKFIVQANIKQNRGFSEQMVHSPDGERIAVVSENIATLLYSTTGRELATLRGHSGAIRGICFSRDGNMIATASLDGTARIWDAYNGKEIKLLKGHKDIVWTAAFSQDSRLIATGSRDGTARLWDVATGTEIAYLRGHSEDLTSVCFSADNRRLVTSSSDKTIRIWEVDQPHRVQSIWNTDNQSITVSRDGARVLTVQQGESYVWDAASQVLIARLKGVASGTSPFSADGRRLITSTSDGQCWVWNIDTAQPIASIKGRTKGYGAATLSADGRRAVIASDGSVYRIWDIDSSEQLSAFKDPNRSIQTALFSPNGDRIVTAAWDNTARVWNAETGAEVATLKFHTQALDYAVYSHNGRRIATAGRDGTSVIWDAESFQPQVILAGHSSFVHTADFSPDGRRVVTTSWDQTAKVWDTETGMLMLTLADSSMSYKFAYFNLEGSIIIAVCIPNADLPRRTASRSSTILRHDSRPASVTWRRYLEAPPPRAK